MVQRKDKGEVSKNYPFIERVKINSFSVEFSKVQLSSCRTIVSEGFLFVDNSEEKFSDAEQDDGG